MIQAEGKSEAPKVDIAHLRRMAMDDDALMSEVLSIFRHQGEQWKKLLDPEVTTPDWLVAAHTIKGSSVSIGAWELAEICGAAENAAQTRMLTRDEKYIYREEIMRAFDDALQEVAKIEHQLAMKSLKS